MSLNEKKLISERDAARAEAEALRRERDNWKAGHDNWKARYDEWRPAANYAQSLSTKGLLPARMLGMHCGDALVALVESMRADRDAAQAELAKARDVLRYVEWSVGDMDRIGACPFCGGCEDETGHAPGCALNAALAAKGGGEVRNLKVGSLPAVNQDEYPAPGNWWVQVWDGDRVVARAYGDTPEAAHDMAKTISACDAMRTERDAAQAEIERLKAALAHAEALYGHRPAGSEA